MQLLLVLLPSVRWVRSRLGTDSSLWTLVLRRSLLGTLVWAPTSRAAIGSCIRPGHNVSQSKGRRVIGRERRVLRSLRVLQSAAVPPCHCWLCR